MTSRIRPAETRRAAVIVNPSKFHGADELADFRSLVDTALAAADYGDTLWLETTVEDPGRGMAREAREAGVDLVIAAGGDGTVRVVAGGLANSDIPIGIMPMGTANLLVRNLELPTDPGKAVLVAIHGSERKIDLVKVTADDGESDHFAVMAGMGADAVIMEEANPKLKKVMGSAAYFFSAVENADHPPFHARVQLDDQEPFDREAILLLVGNVGYLQAKIPLLPDARPDDGRLDLLIASPRSARAKLKLIAEVLFRRHAADSDFDLLSGKRVSVTVDGGEMYELDGDSEGRASTLVAEIVPGALRVRVSDPDPKDRGSSTDYE